MHVKRHYFLPGEEPKVLTANLCEAYKIECFQRGGVEVCPGHREYDAEHLEGGQEGQRVFCICACHQLRKHQSDA